VVILCVSASSACAVLNGLGDEDTTGALPVGEACTAHRECNSYCSTEGCVEFTDLVSYATYRPCHNDNRECNAERYPDISGITCPSDAPCSCVSDTCLASTGVSCNDNADCDAHQFCNITDASCTYTFNCATHADCAVGRGVCATHGCSYASADHKPCSTSGTCGTGEICINAQTCWRLTATPCSIGDDCGDNGVCSTPDGNVCLMAVLL